MANEDMKKTDPFTTGLWLKLLEAYKLGGEEGLSLQITRTKKDLEREANRRAIEGLIRETPGGLKNLLRPESDLD